jgi:hypothetical protein
MEDSGQLVTQHILGEFDEYQACSSHRFVSGISGICLGTGSHLKSGPLRAILPKRQLRKLRAG